jgi:hypothetical protein
MNARALAALCLGFTACAVAPPKPEAVDSRGLATRDPVAARGIAYAPDGRVAYVVVKGERESVVVRARDGKLSEDRAYDFVRDLQFSASGRLAYVARSGALERVVIDGRESRGYEHVCTYVPLVFSRDGARYAYLAGNGEATWLVLDEIEQSLPTDAFARPVFSDDGKHWVYYGVRGTPWSATARSKRQVVLDGEAGPEYDYRHLVGVPRFRPDNGNLFYIAGRDERRFVVDGSREGKAYANVYSPRMSRDGKHVAYVAEPERGRYTVVIDGKEQGPYSCCVLDSELAMDASGSRVAYPVPRGEGAARSFHLNLNGRELGRAYALISQVALSPEGAPESFAFVGAEASGKPPAYLGDPARRYVVVQDEVEGKRYDAIRELQYDGRGRAFYVARTEGRSPVERLVFAGVEGKAYDQIDSLVSRPDGSAFAYRARQGQKFRVVVGDGTKWKEETAFDSVEAPLLLSIRGEAIYRAREGHEPVLSRGGVALKLAQPYDEIAELRLSPDAGEALAVARRGDDTYLLLDGREVARHEGIGEYGTPRKYIGGTERAYPVPGGQLRTFIARDHYFLRYNDRTLFEFDDLTGGGPRFRALGHLGGTELYLLDFYQGDGCPVRYSLVSVNARGEARASEYFGNCNGAKIRLGKQSLVLDFARRSKRAPRETWIFENDLFRKK